jgi:hypothetical protein
MNHEGHEEHEEKIDIKISVSFVNFVVKKIGTELCV